MSHISELSFKDKLTLASSWLQTVVIASALLIAAGQLSTNIDPVDWYRKAELQRRIDEFNSGESKRIQTNVHDFRALFSDKKNVHLLKRQDYQKRFAPLKMMDEHNHIVQFYATILRCGVSGLCDEERSYFFVCNDIISYGLDKPLCKEVPLEHQKYAMFDETIIYFRNTACSSLPYADKVKMKKVFDYDILKSSESVTSKDN